jgi:hypothetical protein
MPSRRQFVVSFRNSVPGTSRFTRNNKKVPDLELTP